MRVERQHMMSEAAGREADRAARADAWQTIASIVNGLRSEHWATTLGLEECSGKIAEGEPLAEWAARNPGEEIWTGYYGETGVEVSGDGTAVAVWAAAPRAGSDEPDWITVTIPIAELGDWEPPELEGPDRRDLALLGDLSEAALLKLARSDDPDDVVAAACSPAVTVDVLRAAGADIDVDIRDGEVAVGLPSCRRTVTVGRVEINLSHPHETADQISGLIGVAVDVTITEAIVDTGDGAVEITVDGDPVRLVGTIDVMDDDDETCDAAARLLDEHGLLECPTWLVNWVYAGASGVPGPYSSYSALLRVDVEL
jgi:hypothetical protein